MLEWKKQQLRRQLQESRYRLFMMNQSFAKDLYEMTFVATKDVWRMSTNGYCIYFDPVWLQKLGAESIDFMLSHQLMHIKLGHIDRPAYYLGDRYHLAADIVANGKLNTMGWNYAKLPLVGKIRYETILPTVNGASITSVQAIKNIPFDPSTMEAAERRRFMIDSENWWDRKEDRGESGEIVLSPLDEDPNDFFYDGPTTGGDFRFRKESFLPVLVETIRNNKDEDKPFDSSSIENSSAKAVRNLRRLFPNHEIDPEASGQERHKKKQKAKTLDWRSLLNSFVQEDAFDYSFTPPDRRVQDTGFFLPDYNVRHETVRDVLFMVDSSGSVSDDIISMAFDEIEQAVEQFHDSLQGTLAFFDTKIYGPYSFSSVADIKKMKPLGGGGTDYNVIFKFINHKSITDKPTSIVIITDGECEFPKATVANGIPVLWLVCGEKVAPWGRSVRIDL